MFKESRRFVIIQARQPEENDTNSEIQWLCESLGLFNERDRDSSCYRIFIELLQNSKNKKGLASDRIAYKLNLTRGTVVHHINKLMKAGIVISESNRYFLRVGRLSSLIDELEEDILEACNDIKKVASKIDSELGL